MCRLGIEHQEIMAKTAGTSNGLTTIRVNVKRGGPCRAIIARSKYGAKNCGGHGAHQNQNLAFFRADMQQVGHEGREPRLEQHLDDNGHDDQLEFRVKDALLL